jgi:hypothetical protein
MRMRNLPSAAVIVAAWVCAGQVSEAQTVTLFGNAVPSTPVDNDTAAVTVGVKFWSSQPGTIAGIRFYRGHKASSSGYTVKLFSASGTLLASAKTGKDTCAVPCWEEVNFASPISIAGNTTYVAAYYTGNGQYADDQYGLTNGIASGSLIAPASGQVGGNGVYTYSTGFPMQVWNASNYYVDISFTPTAPPVAQTPEAVSFSPAGPINVSDSAGAATAIAAIQVTTSDGKPFAGTVSISAQSVNGMVSLSSSVLPSNVQVASINSSDDGTQTVSVQACENGTCTSPATLAMNVVANRGSASIIGLSLSNTTFVGGAPDGTLVGNITATTSDSSTPMLSLIGVQTGSGNDASSFRISSPQLLTNTATGATDQPGQYNICIIASGNYSNSPQQICPTISATGPGGTGWQLAFSDEFNGTMLERLATHPILSMTWSNSVATVVLGEASAITPAACGRANACTISISGATNSGSGGNSLVNGNFLVENVTDSQHFTLWMPENPGATIQAGVIGTIDTGGAIVGTGPWSTTLNTSSNSSSCTVSTPCSGLPLLFQNDDGDHEYYNPQNCVEANGYLEIISTNDGPYNDPQGNTSGPGGPYTYGACHIQTGSNGANFSQGGEIYLDVYEKMPYGQGIHMNGGWLLGNIANWPCAGDIQAAELLGQTNGKNQIQMSSVSGGANCVTEGVSYKIAQWSLASGNFSQAYHQYGLDYNPGVSIDFYGDGTNYLHTVYSDGYMPPPAYVSPMYPNIDPALGDYTTGTPPSSTFTNGNNIFYSKYLRFYKKVTTGACYSAIPAPGTIPHTGTC